MTGTQNSTQNVTSFDKKTIVMIVSLVFSMFTMIAVNQGWITPQQRLILNAETESMIQQLMPDLNLSYQQVVNGLTQEVGSSLSGLAGPYSYMISHPLGDTTITAMKNGTTGAWDFWSTNAASTITKAIGNNTTIFFNAATYSLTDRLNFTNLENFTLRADGWNTKFALANTFNNIVFNISNVHNSLFQGFLVDATGQTSGSAILIDNLCFDNTIDRIYVKTAFHGGIEIYGSRNTVQNSRVINSHDDGIIVGGLSQSIIGNTVENTTSNNLISLYSARGCTISSNTLNTYLTTACGIALEQGSTGNDIVDNIINAGQSMIYRGIYFYPSVNNNNNHVANNILTLNGTGSRGIEIAVGNAYNDVVSNHIYNVTKGVCADDSNNAIDSNYIIDPTINGIFYSAGINAQVDGNYIISDNAVSIIAITIAASNISCNSNFFSGGAGTGIYLSGGATGISTGTINSNTLLGYGPSPTYRGMYLENCTNMQFVGNTVEGWTTGIQEVGAGNNYNTITSSSTRGCTNGILTVGTNTHVNLCWNATVWLP